jgi:hypothetical protein
MAVYRVVRRIFEETYVEANDADEAAEESWNFSGDAWFVCDTEIAAIELQEES